MLFIMCIVPALQNIPLVAFSKPLTWTITCSSLAWPKNTHPEIFAFDPVKRFCYTSQLKHISWLEEDVSRAVDQNSLTPRETTTFDTHVIRSCSLKPRQSCVPAGFKQTIFTHFFRRPQCSTRLRLREKKLHCFPLGQSLSAWQW